MEPEATGGGAPQTRMNRGERSADDKPGTPRVAPKRGMLTAAQYKERLWRRCLRTLDFVSIAISALVIYGAFLITDFMLLNLIDHLFRDEMNESPFLATFFKSARVGLALLAFILFIIHSVRAAWEQYQRDRQLSPEDEKPHV